MTNSEAEARPSFRRSAILVAFIAVAGLIGLWLKAPFGDALMAIAGKPPKPDHVGLDWLLNTQYGWLLMAALAGLTFHRFSGERIAPVFERLVLRDETAPRRRIWLPALLGALALLAFFLLSTFTGQGPSLGKMAGGHPPTPEQMRHLMLLWPLGFVGAGLSEEPIYRFGIITPVIGLACLAFGRDRRVVTTAFWVANIAQALLFGYGHVADGLVASAHGGLLLATLLAPQTWGGLVLGYIYKRWGFETAALSHMMTDFLVPAVLLLMTFAHHAG
jgi:hypothetical protein